MEIKSGKIYNDVEPKALESLIYTTKGGIAAYRDSLRRLQDGV